MASMKSWHIFDIYIEMVVVRLNLVHTPQLVGSFAHTGGLQHLFSGAIFPLFRFLVVTAVCGN